MDTSIIPWCGAHSAPHIVVMGNHKGGSGKSTVAMHIIVALLKAGKRVASFDLDLTQRTLTHYIDNRREWTKQNDLALELPHHCPIVEDHDDGTERDDAADLRRFASVGTKIGFRTARGLGERLVFREFFSTGLTALDPIARPARGVKPSASHLVARLEIRDLVEQIGLLAPAPNKTERALSVEDG